MFISLLQLPSLLPPICPRTHLQMRQYWSLLPRQDTNTISYLSTAIYFHEAGRKLIPKRLTKFHQIKSHISIKSNETSQIEKETGTGAPIWLVALRNEVKKKIKLKVCSLSSLKNQSHYRRRTGHENKITFGIGEICTKIINSQIPSQNCCYITQFYLLSQSLNFTQLFFNFTKMFIFD